MRCFNKFLAAVFLAMTSVAVADEAAQVEKSNLQKIFGNRLDELNASPVNGLYQAVMNNRVFYVSADGRYLFKGDLIDLKTNRNLTEDKKGEQVLKLVKQTPEESMIVFSPEEGKVKHTITVFTDIDCGYCRKLHRHVPELMKLGVRVRYLFFPRAGVGSDAYKKAVSVWCSDNRQEQLTRVKNGQKIPSKSCKHPIDDHMKMVRTLGLSGTPTIILADGRLVPGYVEPKRLMKILNK
jgi:thiol:disulfide interchange protein DsbC